jgi:hypothetical protein
MTRRKFIENIFKFGTTIIIGGLWAAKKVLPEKFVYALKLDKYPGAIKPLSTITKNGKWRG